MSSFYGHNIKLSIFGQSHSEAIGVTIDGLPAGFEINFEELQRFLDRRAPGRNAYSTGRREADKPEFVSGISNGKTCGAPLTALIFNTDKRSADYDNLRDIPRPSHADYAARMKYNGFEDSAGGGHFSGRLTSALCIAGGICIQILKEKGIDIATHIDSIGGIKDTRFDMADIKKEDIEKILSKQFPVIDKDKAAEMLKIIDKAKKSGDSVGGTIECAAIGIPAGIGDPIFDGMENRISQVIFGIPAIKGIEFGNGFQCAALLGSQNNDAFCISNGTISTKTNNHGGVLGGITSGMPLVFRVAVKPTPSIALEQDSVDMSLMENVKLEIHGRHDPCIVPRAVPCVEAAAAIAVYDALLDYKQ